MSDSDTSRSWVDPWVQAWGPMAPMAAPWAQMMRMWTDTMAGWVPGWGAMAGPWLDAMGTTARVSVIVSSEAPVEVRAEVRAGAERSGLRVDALRSRDGSGAPPLETVSIDSHGDGLRVSVTVPEDQPAGRYRGSILDTSGAEQGHVSVEVRPK